MKKILDICKAIIPPGLLVVVGVSLALISINGKGIEFIIAVFNMLLFILAVKLGIVIHEGGHLLAAKLAGGTPKRMTLGRGKLIANTNLWGVNIKLNANLNSGLAYAYFTNTSNIKGRVLLFILGGPFSNFIVAGLLYICMGFTINLSLNQIMPVSVLLFANFVLGITALIPYRVTIKNVKHTTDGLAILSLPFNNSNKLKKSFSKIAYQLSNAQELLLEKKYTEALALYNTLLVHVENEYIHHKVNLSILYLKQGNYQKALAYLNELLPEVENTTIKPFEALLYNNYAWISILTNQLEAADNYSEMAYSLDTKNQYIRGTRGAVLVWAKKYTEAIPLLQKNLNFNVRDEVTFSAAMHLAVAYNYTNQAAKATPLLNFVNTNYHYESLTFEYQDLYNRIMAKINAQVATAV